MSIDFTLPFGGPGGGGAVNNIISNSLAVTTPVAGTKEIEVKVIPILRADMITAINSGGLLPGVTYQITDPIAPLNTMYVKANSATEIDSNMSGTAGGSGFFVQFYWDFGLDRLLYIYCPQQNNFCSRYHFGYTCLDNFDTTDTRFTNCKIIDSNFTEDFSGTMDGVIVEENSDLSLYGNATLDGVHMDPGTLLTINGAFMYASNLGSRIQLTISPGAGYDCCDFFYNGALTLSLGGLNMQYRPYLHEIQTKTATVGGTKTLAVSAARNIICANIDAGGGVAGAFTLQFPVAVFDRQMIIISCYNGSVAAFSVDGNGHSIDSTYGVLLREGTQLIYIYDKASDTWKVA